MISTKIKYLSTIALSGDLNYGNTSKLPKPFISVGHQKIIHSTPTYQLFHKHFTPKKTCKGTV
tara:strand:+ start:695 stop:883 length:189 start_codon:yes stop_codon:yes gene_type:complete